MEQKKESFAKIIGPNISRVFLRKRLMRLLDDGRKKPIIWVHGPAGAGKTTLVASYLKEHKLSSLWYQVDEKDDDVANLFFYLKKAKEDAFPEDKVSLPLLTPEYLAGLTTFTRRYFKQLFSIPKEPCVIVFDNYQDVQFESLFHEILSEGLSIIPENINVILISRKALHPTHSSFKRAGDMKTIGWEELCLTGTEPKGVAQSVGSDNLDDKLLKQLNNRAEGWIAGLLLMLENVNRGERPVIPFVDTAPEMMFDYFSNEIFQKMDLETRDFLSKTAILPHMTSKIAEELTGNREANGILAQLNHNNFFTVIKDNRRDPVYQYHQLFQEFLLTMAKNAFAPLSFSELKKRAAELLEESGQVLEAGELLCRFEVWEEFGQLICRHAEKIVAQGMNQLLWRWLENIPDHVLKKEPWLLYWQGATRILINPSESIPYFERSFHVFKTADDKRGQLITITGIIQAITNEFNDLSALETWIKELDNVKDILQFDTPGKIEFQVSGIIFFAMVLAYPDHDDFDKWKELVIYLFEKSSNPDHKVLIAWPLGIYYYWIGDFTNTKVVVDTMQKLSEEEKITPLTYIMVKVTAAICFSVTAEFEKSIEEATLGLEMARNSGVHLWDIMLLSFCIASSIDSGDLENAGEYIKQVEPYIKKSDNNHHLNAYHFMVSWEAILRKDYINAKINAEISLKRGLVLKSTLSLAMAHYNVSQIAHELREDIKADNHLNEVLKIATRMKSSFVKFMYLVGKAQFAFDRGTNRSGVTYLREAMKLGMENNFETFFSWRPDVMAGLCVKALENGIEKEYVQGLIRSRELVPETPPVNLPEWPWQLKIYTLGRFSITKDEKPIQFSGKSPRKPLLMLKTLIAYGSKGINEWHLIDLLWPEAEGDAAHNAFSVTLKRLRELIGIEGIIILRDGRVTVDPYLCWVDVWCFERIVMEIEDKQEDVRTKKRSTVTTKMAEKAMDIYKGSFLEDDIQNPLLHASATRLRGRFINCINSLGCYFEQKGNLRKAINCYQKGLNVDSTSEEFYQGLMICYKKLGRKAIAIDTYEQCKKTILMAFGRDVSKETKDVYLTIREADK